MVKGKKIDKEAMNGDQTGETGVRNKADYVFEEHSNSGVVTSLGITMHYPSEASIVKEFLESKRSELGIEGTIRICKKIYS